MRIVTVGRWLFGTLCCVSSAIAAGTTQVEPEPVVARAKLLGAATKLMPAGATSNAGAGSAVATGGDVAVVGAPLDASRGAIYVYARPAGGTLAFARRVVAPDGSNGDNAQFGAAVAISEDWLVVGAPANLGTGAAYVFRRGAGADFVFVQKLVAADAESGDEYGVAVATGGETIVVGARLGNFGAVNGGAVYVYVLGGATFQPQQKLTAETAPSPFASTAGANFGAAFAYADDHLYIGAPFHAGGVGLMLKFFRNTGNWTYNASRDGGVMPETFGSAIARSPNGVVYVGAPNAQNGSSQITGAVSVYDDSGAGLTFVGRLQDAGALSSRFGSSVSADDGNLVVGASGFQGGATEQGAYYHYASAGPASVPELRQRVVAFDAGANDKFGASVAFAAGAILAGAPGDDDTSFNGGAAYAYDAAVEEVALVDPAGGPLDVFGSAVAIAGNVKLVGAPHGSGGNGTVEVYFRSIDTWTQSATNLQLGAPLTQFECGFGAAIALSDDSMTAVVGAPSYDIVAAGDDRGRAFVFERTGETWTAAGTLEANDAEDDDNFGASVSISPDGATIVVGAPNKGAGDAGKIYVFRRGGGALASAKGASFGMTGSRGGGIGDKFGSAVGVDDAGTLAVGAPLRSSGRGAVEMLRNDGSGGFLVEPLDDPTGAGGDNFGAALALRGGELVVGIPNADRAGQPASDDAGATMMFDTAGAGSTPRGRVVPADARIGDKFGSSVGVSNGLAIVGAPLRDVPDPGGGMRANAGSARLLLRQGASWLVDAELAASDVTSNDNFGAAVAIRDRSLTAGAPLNDNDASGFADQGASYVFRVGPREPTLFGDGYE